MRREPPPETASQADPVADLQQLARDWITLWQSELAATAVDREAQEGVQTLLAMWAGAAGAMLSAMPRSHDAGPFGARAPAAPRPAAAAAAPDARDAEIERLGRLVGELERRLAELERKGG
jgi:hypothetical protein